MNSINEVPSQDTPLGRIGGLGGGGTYRIMARNVVDGKLLRIQGRAFLPDGGSLLVWREGFEGLLQRDPLLPADVLNRFALPEGTRYVDHWLVVRSGETWFWEERMPDPGPFHGFMFAPDLHLIPEGAASGEWVIFENIPVSFGEAVTLPDVHFPPADGKWKWWVFYPEE